MPTRRSSTWSMRPTPWAPPSSCRRSTSVHRREALAVERDRDAALEGDRDLDRGRRVGRRDGPLVGVGRRRDPRVLEDPGLARAAPQVDVDRVRAGLGDRDLDAALVGVVDLLVAGQAHPDAHRRDDLEPRIERVRRDIEADLVVALAGAAVGDRVGALALGDLDEELRDQRPGERGRQRVGALVQRVGLEVRPHEVGHEPLAGIDDVGARRAGRHRPLLDALAQRAAAEVDGQRDHLGVVLLLEPGDGDGRIESARVGEDDLLHEYGTSAIDDGDAPAPMASKRARHRSRRASSAKRTRSVLSPARVPSCSCSVDSSIACAITLAVPGVPVSTRISPLRPIVTGMSLRIRWSRSFEATVAVGTRSSRRHVDVAVGARRLHQPEVRDVARHRGLRDREALLGQRVHQLALAAHRSRHHELADGPLAEALELLAGHVASSVLADPGRFRRRRRRPSGPR